MFQSDKPVKLVVKGWIEADDKEPYTNIPSTCPRCGAKLRRVDCLKICGIYMVWCPVSICRWCEIYEE